MSMDWADDVDDKSFETYTRDIHWNKMEEEFKKVCNILLKIESILH